jgi:hypothetical protein
VVSLTAAAVVVGPGVGRTRVGSSVLVQTPVTADLAIGNWNAPYADLTVGCPGCGPNVTGGSLLVVEVKVVPHCGSFGCTSEINATDVAFPFLLEGVNPSLPVPLAPQGITLNLTVRTPASAGSYDLNGSISTPPPPGPVVISTQTWTAVNSTGGTGGLRIAPVLPDADVAGGTVFNETVVVNNSLEPFEDVVNISVSAPFLLLAKGPAFPFELNINQSGPLDLRIRAPPTPGSYNLNGTVFDRPHPLVFVSSVNVSFVGVSVALQSTSVAGVPRYSISGADLNGSVVISNPTNASHWVTFNRTNGDWFFVNGTPNGSWAIPSNQSVRFYFTLLVDEPAGSYPLGLVFQILSEPTRRRAAPRSISAG